MLARTPCYVVAVNRHGASYMTNEMENRVSSIETRKTKYDKKSTDILIHI